MRSLARIKPLHAELIPPQGARAAGVTPDGKQLYTLTRERSRKVPRMEVGPDGKERQVWRKNQMTGEPLYPVNRPEKYVETILFYLESQGNNNIALHPYIPPTAEQLADEERRRRIAEMKEALAEALVDADLTPADLLARVQENRVQAETTTGADVPVTLTDEASTVTTASAVSYPVYAPPGRWQLSNGTIVKCKKEEALALEAQLRTATREAAEDAAASPEE